MATKNRGWIGEELARSLVETSIYLITNMPGSCDYCYTTGSPSSLYEPHKEHDMTSNNKGLYGIFFKISREVVKSENSQ